MTPKYPDIHVQLSGHDGNAFAIMGRVIKALRKAAVPQHKLDKFTSEATSGDYNNVILTAVKWVEVE